MIRHAEAIMRCLKNFFHALAELERDDSAANYETMLRRRNELRQAWQDALLSQ